MRWNVNSIRYALAENGYELSTDAADVGFKDRPRFAVLGNGRKERYDSLKEIAETYRLNLEPFNEESSDPH